MFERITKPARQAVLDAIATAGDLGAAKAEPVHLLLAIADKDVAGRVLGGYGVTVAQLRAAVTGDRRRAGLTDTEISALRSVGIDADEVFRRIEEAFGPGALDEAAAPEPRRRRGRLGGPFDAPARKAIELSLREAIALGHRSVGTGHFLLALLRVGLPESVSAVLAEHGVTYDDAKRRTLAELDRAA